MHADYTAGILSRTGLTRMPSAPTSTRNTPRIHRWLALSFQYAPECPNTAFTVFNAMSKSEIIDQFST